MNRSLYMCRWLLVWYTCSKTTHLSQTFLSCIVARHKQIYDEYSKIFLKGKKVFNHNLVVIPSNPNKTAFSGHVTFVRIVTVACFVLHYLWAVRGPKSVNSSWSNEDRTIVAFGWFYVLRAVLKPFLWIFGLEWTHEIEDVQHTYEGYLFWTAYSRDIQMKRFVLRNLNFLTADKLKLNSLEKERKCACNCWHAAPLEGYFKRSVIQRMPQSYCFSLILFSVPDVKVTIT